MPTACLGAQALTEFLFQRHVDLFHGLVQNGVELTDSAKVSSPNLQFSRSSEVPTRTHGGRPPVRPLEGPVPWATARTEKARGMVPSLWGVNTGGP